MSAFVTSTTPSHLYPAPQCRSPRMHVLREHLKRYAQTDSAVLIRGETGSGKEVAARQLHQLSPRCSGPFIAVNCGAIPADLVEAELFGTALGAFTGARKRRGWFELAHRGTLFLDEIGDLPLSAQTTLLRTLENGVIWPVGAEQAQHVDIRIVCATHRPVLEMVKERTFRQDLYHRISTLSVFVPPLRHRKEDMMSLAHAFFGERADELSPSIWRRIEAYDWPGNVREFRNVLTRAFIHASPGPVRLEHLTFSQLGERVDRDVSTRTKPLHEALAEHVGHTLRLCGGNVRATARALRVSPTTVYRYLATTTTAPHGEYTYSRDT